MAKITVKNILSPLVKLCEIPDERTLLHEAEALVELLAERAREETNMTDKGVIRAAATVAVCDRRDLADCMIRYRDGTVSRVFISLTEYPLTDGEDVFFYCDDVDCFMSLMKEEWDIRIFIVTEVFGFK